MSALRRSRRMGAVVTLLLAALLLGCASLTPWEELKDQQSSATWIDISGTAVHVVAVGEGEPVVLVHGFGGSSFVWREVQADLSTDFRVIAVDLHGFGFSERPTELDRYTRAGQIELLVKVAAHFGFESAHYVGHSYGGSLVMTLAATQPERVRTLTLINSAPIEYPKTRRRLLAGWPFVVQPVLRVFGLKERRMRRALERSFSNDELVTDELVGEYLRRLRVRGAGRAYRGLTAPLRQLDHGPVGSYEEISSPVLVLWGEDDTLVTVEEGRRAAQRLANHEFRVIEGAGHIPMEERPVAIARAVAAFLGSSR